MQPIIEASIEAGATVHTDELKSYANLGKIGYTHNTVEHGIGEYAKGNCHVNGLEGFWSHLKKSINGTHIHVSKKHLNKYISEFEYRYNSRQNPEKMFDELVSSFAKPSDVK